MTVHTQELREDVLELVRRGFDIDLRHRGHADLLGRQRMHVSMGREHFRPGEDRGFTHPWALQSGSLGGSWGLEATGAQQVFVE